MQVAVVGAGIMGCSAARALAMDGHEVVLYEQFHVGHDHGSSHGRSRIVRLAYPDEEWVRLAEESLAGWRELEEECDVRLLELHGMLELAADVEHGSRRALAAAGAEFELLTGSEVRARWPVDVPDGWVALYQPQAGIVRADVALHALLDSARSHGAQLEETTRIESVAGVEADVVVVTAGPWATKLVPSLPVRTTRETVVYFRRTGPVVPPVVQLDPATRWRAMYSLRDPVYGLKAGAHHTGPESDPDDGGVPSPSSELVERVASWVAATHPDADPRPVDAQTCMYTMTDDEHFILRRRGRLVIGSACSGHGFKFAPAVGRRLADLVSGTVRGPADGPLNRPLTGPVGGPVGSPVGGPVGGPTGGPTGGPVGGSVG
ncbi:MAG TPA: FAD-dependent oxidoreductase [Pseudonocardiaceae bacterium]